MSNVIRWEVNEASQIDYDQALVYRATSEDGSYTLISTQSITDNTYNDEDGTSSSWYKVKFNNSSTSKTSELSEALKAATFIGYCSVTDIRNMTNITTDDLSDTEVANLIQDAAVQLNKDINIEVVRERVESIDTLRSNDINGTNTTFYVKNWEGRYISDKNDDAEVTTSDLSVIYKDSDGTETSANVSSIVPGEGKFVMSTAPSNQEVYVSYNWSARDASVPDGSIRLACKFLSTAYCYSKINIGRPIKTDFGNTKITRDMESYNHYVKRYNDEIDKINSSWGGSLSAFADSPYTV